MREGRRVVASQCVGQAVLASIDWGLSSVALMGRAYVRVGLALVHAAGIAFSRSVGEYEEGGIRRWPRGRSSRALDRNCSCSSSWYCLWRCRWPPPDRRPCEHSFAAGLYVHPNCSPILAEFGASALYHCHVAAPICVEVVVAIHQGGRLPSTSTWGYRRSTVIMASCLADMVFDP